MELNLTMKVEIDTDHLTAAQEAVLRCWSDDLGIKYDPSLLNEELTHDEMSYLDGRLTGLIKAHNILLNLRRSIYTTDWSND